MIKRIIPMLFGAAALFLFGLPLILRRILNIGNATGILIGSILLLYGIFMPVIHKKISGIWKKKIGKILLLFAAFGIGFVVGLAAVETVCIVKAAKKKPAENATLIVLGCKVYGEKASRTLQERLDAAYDYLVENEDTDCVLSGGQGRDEDISEALCMYRYLEEKGIDTSRLYLEDTSTTTRENLSNSLQIIRENGLNEKIAIATSDFHEYRAGEIADALGLEYGAVPGRSAWWLLPTYYVRELYGILYQWCGLGEDAVPEKTLNETTEVTETTEITETSKITEITEPSQAAEETISMATAKPFYASALTDEIKEKITGISYPASDKEAEISYEDLSVVHVQYYDFSGIVQEGELVCNQAIAQDLVEIFETLYEEKYPIEKIRLVDEYGGDDDASMADNNSSCFNYRVVAGTKHLSNHAYGLAVDINPLYNPYITTRNGKTVISPAGSEAYTDRSGDFEYKIDENDLCYKLFTEHGFTWGGAWTHSKDYQHFEKRV